MSQTLYQLDNDVIDFPPAERALTQPNGLLAIGGDLSTQRLLHAYSSGIFPWNSPDEPILWWSPDPRGILELDELHVSRSLRKKLKKEHFTFSINTQFEDVIIHCADARPDQGTWITDEMIDAYIKFHQAGYAHSLEVWQNEKLVGGLYGISIGNIFCGESMFHWVTDASKAATVALVDLLKHNNYAFIDCQMLNPHLASLGAKEISRASFLERLTQAQITNQHETHTQCWLKRDYRLTTYVE